METVGVRTASEVVRTRTGVVAVRHLDRASQALDRSLHPLDRVILALVFVLSLLPFSQVMMVRVSGLTLFAYDFVYLALALVLLTKLVTSPQLAHPAPFFLFVAGAALSTAFALAAKDPPSAHMILYQARNFLPFVIASLVVATGTTIPLRKLLLLLCFGALISASAALIINYVFPGFLVGQFSFAQEIGELAVAQGRLHWTNDSLVFVPFAAAALLPGLKGRALFLVFLTAVVTAAVSFNRLNRTVLAGLAAYLIILLVGSMLSKKAARLAAPIAGRVMLVLLLLAGMIYVLVSSNPQLAKTASERFPTNAEKLQTFLQGDIGQERGPIWSHYLHFPPLAYLVGQGLGEPLITVSQRVIYTSDVSYFAFLLVFGILGLASLGVFVWVLFARLRSTSLPRPPNAWALTALLIVVMLISLNVDWLSRDNMVIYLSLLVMSATARASWKNEPSDGREENKGREKPGGKEGGADRMGRAGG